MVHNYIWTTYKWRLAKNASCLQHGESAHENLKYAHLIPYIIWIKIRTPNQPQICWLQLSISFGGNHFEPQPYQISRLFIKLRLCSCYSWKYHLPHLTETSLLRKGHGTKELQSWRLHDQLISTIISEGSLWQTLPLERPATSYLLRWCSQVKHGFGKLTCSHDLFLRPRGLQQSFSMTTSSGWVWHWAHWRFLFPSKQKHRILKPPNRHKACFFSFVDIPNCAAGLLIIDLSLSYILGPFTSCTYRNSYLDHYIIIWVYRFLFNRGSMTIKVMIHPLENHPFIIFLAPEKPEKIP